MRTVVMAEVADKDVHVFATMPTLKFQPMRMEVTAAHLPPTAPKLPTLNEADRLREELRKAKEEIALLKAEPTSSASEVPLGGAHAAMEAASVYILPPIKYPDGKYYIKVGGGANAFVPGIGGHTASETDSFEAVDAPLRDWMVGQGDAAVGAQLLAVLRYALPSFVPASWHCKPCFTTCTDDGKLQLHRHETRGQDGSSNVVMVAAVCQGKAAGPALAIGADVASILLEGL
jgi:sarcosine oxidase